MTTTNDPLESYIGRFQAKLTKMTIAQRQDIVDEIRAHVHERVASSGLSIPEVLEKLGRAEDLAGEYYRGTLVPEAGTGFSPWKVLRAGFALAMTGAHGIVMMVIVIWGGAGALACFAAVVARQVFPEQTALWVTPDFEFGIGPDRPVDAQAFLDNWFQPLAFGLGVLFLMLTTTAVRYLLPRLKRWGTSALQPIDLPSLAGARAAALHLSSEFADAQSRLTHRVRARWQNG
jgi:hypothetical protein